MPWRRCLGCSELIPNGSRCRTCAARLKALRNADRSIAKAVVAASPRCSCTNPTCLHKPAECRGTDLTADHVLPLIQGGTNEGQRQVLCRRCNSRKGAR